MLEPSGVVLIAHPGHELLLHGWLQRTRPLVFILTDGSGHAGQPRMEYSRRLLESMGVPLMRGSGSLSDKQAYRLIIEGRSDRLVAIASELAVEIVERGVEFVVADAAEGYNPAHDLSRMLAGAACALASRASLPPHQYEFAIARLGAELAANDDLVYELSPHELAAKLAAARDYWPLRDEIDQQLQRTGADVLRTEILRRVPDWQALPACALQPAYERFGAQRVTAGHYHTVIRYADHLAPLQQQLSTWLEEQDARPDHQLSLGNAGRHTGLRS